MILYKLQHILNGSKKAVPQIYGIMIVCSFGNYPIRSYGSLLSHKESSCREEITTLGRTVQPGMSIHCAHLAHYEANYPDYTPGDK